MSNRELIEQYYRTYRGELLQFVGSRLGVFSRTTPFTVEDAEDLVQELFLRLLSDSHRPIAEATLPNLVMTMACRQVVDRYRRLAHRRAFEAHAEAVLSADYRIEPAIYVDDTLRHIERSLDRLPKATADIYRLHLYGGMQCADISSQLSLDYKTVEYRLGRARRLVRNLLRRAV
ncbi:MAG: sigma-70 family RNA polymerase sigma factor [Prevotella sp.]|nr:sigma-70 family RNA polymerase sigma factor [Prevotella sp.]